MNRAETKKGREIEGGHEGGGSRQVIVPRQSSGPQLFRIGRLRPEDRVVGDGDD